MGLQEQKNPGILVTEKVSRSIRTPIRQPTSTLFAVGFTPWGPDNIPVKVTRWEEFEDKLGGFTSSSLVDEAVFVHLESYRAPVAQVVRVVGPSAAKATLTLMDRATTALQTIRVDAKYKAALGNTFTVEVQDGTASNTYKLIIKGRGLTETFDNLDLTAAKLDEVNQKSELIELTDLGSTSAAPTNNPAVLAATALTGGSDDEANLTDTEFVGADTGTTRTGLQAFNDKNLGTGQVAIPGVTSTTVHAALVTHAESFNRLALLDPPQGDDPTQVINNRKTNIDSMYAAMYYPWVEVREQFQGSGLKKFSPPSGFAAGAMAFVDRMVGPHKAPANVLLPRPFAIGLERYPSGLDIVNEKTNGDLNEANVNGLRSFGDGGLKIFGERLATNDPDLKFVHERRLLNQFKVSLDTWLDSIPFSVVDGRGRIFRDMTQKGRAFFRPYFEEDALFGPTEEDAFLVRADKTNNPPEQLALGVVRFDAFVKISPTAEKIQIALTKSQLAEVFRSQVLR